MSPKLDGGGFGLLPVPDVDFGLLQLFSCGKIHIDSFLRESALDYHHARLGYAWVVVHINFPTPVAYFTLNNDALKLTTFEVGELELKNHVDLNRFPAVNIGRLAVDQKLQRTGVSDQVMALALDQIRGDTPTASAARLVIVDAYNEPRVIRYYERHGFLKSIWAENKALKHLGKGQRQTIKMLRDIMDPWLFNS
jgi:GNAT superfamily N-acetyltransferase